MRIVSIELPSGAIKAAARSKLEPEEQSSRDCVVILEFGTSCLTTPLGRAELRNRSEEARAPLGCFVFHEKFILFGVVVETYGPRCLVSDGFPSPSQVPP